MSELLKRIIIDIDPMPIQGCNWTPSGSAYQKPKRTNFKKYISAIVKKEWNAKPILLPIHVVFTHIVPIKDKRKWGKICDKRPDRDNYSKGVQDACNGILWVDDGQIYWGEDRKYYGQIGKVMIEVYQAEKETSEYIKYLCGVGNIKK